MRRSLDIQIPPNLRERIVKIEDYSFKNKIASEKFDLWVAKQNKDNENYVFAKQIGRKSTRNLLNELLQQVSSLAQIKHPFIFEFVGITTKSPFTGFSYTLPNRSLHHLLNDPNYDTVIDGSRSTIIALCVANAMEYTHQHGLSVNHLSTESIFLNEKLVPVLSLIEEGCVNPPIWTPPEVYRGQTPDEKSDVFLYGFVLFELLTGVVPFQGLTLEEAEEEICVNRKRPALPEETPETLKLLIKHCWSPRKINRPTFKEIYELFQVGAVLFPNGSYSVLTKFIKSVKHLKRRPNPISTFDLYNTVTSIRRATRTGTTIGATVTGTTIVGQRDFVAHNTGYYNFEPSIAPEQPRRSRKRKSHDQAEIKNLKSPPKSPKIEKLPKYQPTRLDDEDIDYVQPPHENNQQDNYVPKPESPRKLEITLDALDNFIAPEFNDVMEQVTEIVNADNITEFMAKIPPLMKKMVPSEVKNLTIDALINILNYNEAFEALYNADILEKLPVSSKSTSDGVFNLLNIAFHHSPKFATFGVTRLFSSLLDSDPERTLVLQAILAKKFDELEEKETFSEQIIKFSQTYLKSPVAAEYLATLTELVKNKYFKNKFGSQCKTFFVDAINAREDDRAVRLGYIGLISMQLKMIPVSLETIAEDLMNPGTADCALAVLVRSGTSIEPTRNLVQALLDLAQERPLATTAILRYLGSYTVATSCVSSADWMLSDLPTLKDTVRIFLAIFQHSSLRSHLVTLKELPDFLARVACCEDEEIRGIIGPIISQLPLVPANVQSFSRAGFFEGAFQCAAEAMDDNVRLSAIKAITRLAELSFSPEYVKYAHRLVECVDYGGVVAKRAFAAMNALSVHMQCLKALAKAGAAESVKNELNGKIDNRTLQTFLAKVERA